MSEFIGLNVAAFIILVIFAIGSGFDEAIGWFLAPLSLAQVWFPPALILFLFVPVYTIPAILYLIAYPFVVKEVINGEFRKTSDREFMNLWHIGSWLVTAWLVLAILS